MPFVHMENKSVGVNHLTEGQMREIFTKHANKDGQISKEELKKAFRKLGSRFSDFRSFRALQHADANGDGMISTSELDDVVKYALRFGLIKRDDLTPAFKSYSRRESEPKSRSSVSDKDGQISTEEKVNKLPTENKSVGVSQQKTSINDIDNIIDKDRQIRQKASQKFPTETEASGFGRLTTPSVLNTTSRT